MTLGRLGITNNDRLAILDSERSDRESLLNQMKRLNDFLALMTNETDPPSEESTADETT